MTLLLMVMTLRLLACEQSPQDSYKQLISAKYFAFGGVGFAGRISEGEIAFHTVVATTDALSRFNSAMTNQNFVARLYALCALRKLDPEAFDRAAKPLLDPNARVTTMMGCEMQDEKVSEVVGRIKSGFYDAYIKDWK